jgi:hypothetical protein
VVFVPCPNVVQIEMLFTASTQPCENVYHVLLGTAPTPASMLTLAGLFDSWDSTHLSGARSTQTFLQKVIARDLSTAGAPAVEFDVSPSRVGTAGGNPQPNNVTLSIEWRTGFTGRSFRGRTYHIGLADSGLGSDAQEVTSIYAANILAVYEALLTTVGTTSSQQMVVLSRYHGVDPVTKRPIPRAAGVATPITNCVLADPFIDSQRRRLPNHNRHR